MESSEVQAIAETPVFDPKAFHEDVMATVKATYTEVNPCTIFYKARDKGSVTDCQHISQAVDYWNYLVDLAVDAKDWIKEQTEKKKDGCGRSPEYYVFNRDFNTTVRAANSLSELAGSKIDWKAKLAPFNRTLYGVGTLAGQLLENA
jgi:transcription elongation factor Elf1